VIPQRVLVVGRQLHLAGNKCKSIVVNIWAGVRRSIRITPSLGLIVLNVEIDNRRWNVVLRSNSRQPLPVNSSVTRRVKNRSAIVRASVDLPENGSPQRMKSR
jgi:hypothetical protein